MIGNANFTGLKEFSNALENISKEITDQSNKKSILFDEVLTKSFMSKNTPYTDFDDFLESGGFSVNSQEEFDSINENELDAFVSANTKFSGFQEMIDTAGHEYFSKRFEKLGFK